MSLHSSLKRAEKLSSARSVMKRVERLKWLKERGTWKEGGRVSGLPKIKILKLKTVKKEKKEEKSTETTTAVATDAQVAAKPDKAVKPQAAKPAQPKK
ncbi:MAG: small basic protein [Candidatus Omnitrophota bacterium]|jgi:small basic protein (TIGR04137 family)